MLTKPKFFCKKPQLSETQIKHFYDMTLNLIELTDADGNWSDKFMHVHYGAMRLATDFKLLESCDPILDAMNNENYKYLPPLLSYSEKEALRSLVLKSSNEALHEWIQDIHLVYDFFPKVEAKRGFALKKYVEDLLYEHKKSYRRLHS